MAFNRMIASAACCAFLTACGPSNDRDQASAGNQVRNQPAPIAPVVPKALDRSDMLLAFGKAASAFALGQDDGAAQRELDGKIFEFRMRYGCQPAPAGPIEPLTVAFDAQAKTLRLTATPGMTTEDPTIAAVTHGQVEAVEGFWIERPWLFDAGCPRTRPATQLPDADVAAPVERRTAPQPVPAARFGLAQFFRADESRTLRRDARPYQVTRTLSEGSVPSTAGYDVVLAGRLRKMPDGKVIACTPSTSGAAPSCVASVAFDRVSIRRGDNDEILAEWGSS